MSLLFDVIADLPEGIAVTPVFAADKAEALEAGKELFPGHWVTVVLEESEPAHPSAPPSTDCRKSPVKLKPLNQSALLLVRCEP